MADQDVVEEVSPELAAIRLQIEQYLTQLQATARAVAEVLPVVKPLRLVIETFEKLPGVTLRDAEDAEVVEALLDIFEMAGSQLLQLNEIAGMVQAERVERGEEP